MVLAHRTHADKVQHQERRLPGKEKVVVQQADRHAQRKDAAPAVDGGVVQRRQQIREDGRRIQKEIEKDIVDVEPAERIQDAAQHGHAVVLGPAADPQVGAAAGHRKFQAEHGRHQPGDPARRQQDGQPEKRAAQRVIRVSVDKAAAQIGGPAERAPLLDKVVGVGIERDHLVVEVAGVMEKVAV